jgi:hypothetical protein
MTPTLLVSVTVLLYLAAGLGREFLTVSYYKAISSRKKYSASGLAGGIELWDFLVLATIIKSDWNPILILAYVAGTMLGTQLSMRIFDK